MEEKFSSLYLHIPFCLKKCNYCAFYSIPYDTEKVELFVSSIIKEMELTQIIPHHINTIYIGGGTPSSLSVNYLEKIFENLFKFYKMDKNLEFTVEINPGAIKKEQIELFKSYGVNRISIGAQSFLDKELKFLNRIHNSKDIKATVNTLLSLGIENISIDLLYGIPKQTLENFRFSLQKVTLLEIKHISLYELSLDKKTPLARKIKEGQLVLPSERTVEKMYLYASEFLDKKGFHKYEISNFAKQDYECKHNIVYWQRKPYLGLGPSAHSFIGGIRFSNYEELFSYAKNLRINKLAWINREKIEGFEKLKEIIILGLRMKDGIKISNPCLIEFLKDFMSLNLVNITDNNTVSLTDKGMLLSNEIFARVLLHIENCLVCKEELVDHLLNEK